MDSIEEVGSVDPRLGEGEFPPELDRLNWGAALLGMLWALSYAPWSWFFLLVAVRVVLLAVSILVAGPFADAGLRSALIVVYMLVYWSFVAMLASRANRLVWEGDRRRVARQSDESVPRPAMTLSAYKASQRRWVIGGIFYHLLLWGDVIVIGPSDPTSRMVTLAVDVIVIASLLVVDRMGRQRSPS